MPEDATVQDPLAVHTVRVHRPTAELESGEVPATLDLTGPLDFSFKWSIIIVYPANII